jgi:hypothetical protein
VIAPLAPTLLPLGSRAHVMPQYYPDKNSQHLYVQVIRHYRNRGATSVRGEALGVSNNFNDFYRAEFFIFLT